jgi:hypothetical protein
MEDRQKQSLNDVNNIPVCLGYKDQSNQNTIKKKAIGWCK